MEKKDGRELPHAVREEIRKRAVSRVLAGESPEVVIESLGFHRSCIYDWLKQYRRRGEAGLETKPIPGRPRKFDDVLWAGELRELIRDDPRQFKAKVSERTLGNILKRLDITVRRPRLKAVE